MIKKPCINKCTTTSLSADIICKGCGITDKERASWGSYTDIERSITITLCEYRVRNHTLCEEIMLKNNKEIKQMNDKAPYRLVNIENKVKSLEAKVKELEFEKGVLTIDLIIADKVVEAIDKQIKINQLDARSMIADARLDYGKPYEYKYLALTTTNKG